MGREIKVHSSETERTIGFHSNFDRWLLFSIRRKFFNKVGWWGTGILLGAGEPWISPIIIWLALPARRWRWSHLARSLLPAVSRKKNFPESHTIKLLLTKFTRSRWLDIGFVPFCKLVDLDFVSVHKRAKKRTWPISSHLDYTLGQWYRTAL